MDLKPLGDRIIVEVLEEEQTTVSGIVLPDTAQEKPQRAKVLAVGPGHYEDGQVVPLDVAVGDEGSSRSTEAPRSSSASTST